ncbi:MBL fold metallo-hydrolase [Photobacterium rosenbergii]|uniref:MBL fold metallo-hydrolase n=1 Tax=Photobacterium rosenbergii TaxID=294936 RepID=A0ABU3ZNP3_9GAMM|nr:MBL fold metallo-hydrolase [Photobacterium rosenbergii]MDV5171608.1 MBL fold metallo-hydrolase [Photobacterium rosenbergii]
MLIAAFCFLLASASLLYLRQPQFASPVVVDRTYIAPYHSGVFHNTVPAPILANSDGLLTAWIKFLTNKIPEATPDFALPSEKTDLHALDKESNVMVWMGHSSYFIQLDGVRFLVDPVFSDNASPVPYTNLAFEGSNIYQAEDIPEVDYLLITHDHWDHLDHPSVVAVREKVAQAITPIGVGSYLTQWGYDESKVFEGDWYDSFEQGQLQIHILPAQHFSGRLLKRNQTLWGSFALIMPKHKVYIGGDSGYGDHFRQIHARLGAFDVAILEAGQYNENWRHIHMMPEETVQATLDLQAKAMIPAHNSKFKLSKHAWHEPLERISELSHDANFRLMTPMIGQVMWLDDEQQNFERWWQQ